MNTALLIASSAGSTLHRHAYAFTLALTKQTSVRLIYFAGPSVNVVESEHTALLQQWQALARAAGCALYLCSNGAKIADSEAALQDIEIIGHATWIALSSDVDRVFTFPGASS